MDLDTYESCLHALETCKDHFIEGSILSLMNFLSRMAKCGHSMSFRADMGWNGVTGLGVSR